MKVFKTPSPHFNERTLPIDSILIHYTDMPTAAEALAWFSNPASNVSAHYLIDEKGYVYQLVPENKRAWHAGESYWQGCTDLNSCSVGIELANPGHSYGYLPFPEAQIDALMWLCKDIMTRWNISPSRILGHSDVAPRRKQDPGHLFPWEKLAQEKLGLWKNERVIVSKAKQFNFDFMEGLHKIGYETVSPTHTLLAFQRHFQPHKVDGIADEETFSLLQALLNLQNKHI